MELNTLSTRYLKAAIDQLASNYDLAQCASPENSPALHRALRDGVIQAFELTYTVALKLFDRALEDRFSDKDVDRAGFRDRIRMGIEAGFIETLDDWLLFRAMRNETSHTYDEFKAMQVYAGIPAFITAARKLEQAIESYAHDA